MQSTTAIHRHRMSKNLFMHYQLTRAEELGQQSSLYESPLKHAI